MKTNETFNRRRWLMMSKEFEKDEYKIMVSGDSISKGIVFDEEKGKYSFLEENYVSLLQGCLKGAVYNAARFGSTIMKGISRLQNELVRNKPDIVLVEYGGNDCDFNWEEVARDPHGDHLPKTDFDLFRQSLIDVIGSLKNKGIVPILVTLPPLDADRYFKWVSKNSPAIGKEILTWLGCVTRIYWWQERYSSAIVNVAEQTKTKLIDIRGAFLQWPDFTKFLCVDGIHPNKEGHKIIADKIMEYIHSNYSFLLKDETSFAVFS
jgi:lysophospholipase L1-like esterase